MKIAAIDLGSNSFHMVVVETLRGGAFRVIGTEKEMVRLGARTLSRGKLSAAAMKRGLGDAAQVQAPGRERGGGQDPGRGHLRGARGRATARTSSIGSARELGIWPKAVSGEDEARLIYLAALHSVHLEGRRALVIDIGGGSVELALGAGKRAGVGGLARSSGCCA